MSLSAAAISGFDPLVLAYTADVSVVVSEVRITPTALDMDASITVNSTVVASGGSLVIPLALGTNEILVEVNATRTYTISIG